MKTLLYIAAISLALFGPATLSAQGDHPGHDMRAGHDMKAQAGATTEMPLVDGVVRSVDKAAETVTLAHGPLTNLNMPAMTMAFRVKDAAWLAQMKAGDKIRFLAENIDGAITVVHFEPAE